MKNIRILLLPIVFSGLLIPEIYAQMDTIEVPEPSKKVVKLIEKVKKANNCGWKDTILTAIDVVTKDTTSSIKGKYLDANLNGIYIKIVIDTCQTTVMEVFLMDVKTGTWILDVWGDGKLKKNKGDKYYRTLLFGIEKQYKSMIGQAIIGPFGRAMRIAGVVIICGTITYASVILLVL